MSVLCKKKIKIYIAYGFQLVLFFMLYMFTIDFPKQELRKHKFTAKGITTLGWCSFCSDKGLCLKCQPHLVSQHINKGVFFNFCFEIPFLPLLSINLVTSLYQDSHSSSVSYAVWNWCVHDYNGGSSKS